MSSEKKGLSGAIIGISQLVLRLSVTAILRLFYRLRVEGRENIPTTGPALLVPNHVSLVDALLLAAATRRKIRFVMERSIYGMPVLHHLFRLMEVIPVSAKDGRKEIVAFIRSARAALDDGCLVCIFAEGAVTRNGMLGAFRGGFRRIVQGSGYPVVPVYIGGAWGSIFSYSTGSVMSRLPSRVPYPVRIHFGAPLSSEAGPFEVRQAVAELSCRYFDSMKRERRPLPEEFLRRARKNWGSRAVADTSGRVLSYGETATAAHALSRRLAPELEKGEHAGILLPPSVPGVLANLAVSMLGCIPVNLNYTTSQEGLAAAVRRCGIRKVITSRAFLQKIQVRPDVRVLFVEDILRFAGWERLVSFLAARLLPPAFLCSGHVFDPDSPATVIFSSGSTAEPKGVVLTHHNIVSNVEALRTVFRTKPDDNICAALPFFHSFGFTGTLWFPLLGGFSAVYHANPMEGEKVAAAARLHRSTLLLATPTFLQGYLRRARREDFATLRAVVTGAEKLSPRLADLFEEKFGIRPLEGYGATELSPVVALGLPDVEIAGVRQQGSASGTVGLPLPGVAVRVLDPQTGELLPEDAEGIVTVRGPNVMKEYLGDPAKTGEVIVDGWYRTGDIGSIDGSGFLRITGRISRFSKIGGEMVPHGAVEEEVQSALGTGGTAAVTSLPDERKGERLVVLYTGTAEPGAVYSAVAGSKLPNLWKPARDSYVRVEELPLLGTGKPDLRGLRDLAERVTGGKHLRGEEAA